MPSGNVIRLRQRHAPIESEQIYKRCDNNNGVAAHLRMTCASVGGSMLSTRSTRMFLSSPEPLAPNVAQRHTGTKPLLCGYCSGRQRSPYATAP